MKKPPAKRESLVLKLLEGVFIQIPLGVAGVLLDLGSRVNYPALKNILVGLLVALSLLTFMKIERIFDALYLLLTSDGANPAWTVAVQLGFFYLIYIIIPMPFLILIAHLRREGNLFKHQTEKRDPDLERMRINRFYSNRGKAYLGESFKSGTPLYLTNAQRQMHVHVVGSTGTGKTESVLLPMLAHDMAHGKGAIIIDGKGDLELLDRIHYIAKKKGRKKDFYFFSLAHPGRSNTYNPLLRGSATELKDKIIGGMAWSKEFFRDMAEQATLTVLNAIFAKNQGKEEKEKEHVKYGEIYGYLTDIGKLKRLAAAVPDQGIKQDIDLMINQFKENQRFLSGLKANLFLSARSEFSSLLDTDYPEIDILEVYRNRQICYFQMALEGFQDTARRMGRMILQDIRTVSNYIKTHIPESKRSFFPVFIDDASSFLELNFIDFLNKARSAGFGIHLMHQSIADLEFRGALNFPKQVVENTNVKIILRQDDPQSVERFTKIAGTRRTMISTYQTEEKMLGKGLTGTGSVREGQTFRIEPDLIRALKLGEAALIWKSPSLHTDHVKLDFFGHPPYPGDFEPMRKNREKKQEKESEAPAVSTKLVASDGAKTETAKPKESEQGVTPPDVAEPLSFVEETEKRKRIFHMRYGTQSDKESV